MTAHGSIDSRRTDPQVLSISSGGNLVVSVTAVLGAIHHAAGPLASSKMPRKPTSVDMRNAAGIALSISELVRESEVHAREALWTVEVPEDPVELSRRAGASLDKTEDAVRLLVAAEVVSRVGLTGGGARLRVEEAMFAEEPVLAQVAWEEVRERLAAVRASVTPALAVVRELARSTRLAETKEAGSSWASLTLGRFVERTLFQRTAVSRAISALQEAGVIERGQPRGHEGQYRPVAGGVRLRRRAVR
ncbi:MAG: hypothetical protein GEU90_03685 [Gemmatimonas sp.]|nr:hypothetical protein [Gemmatimonas sp.]